LVVDIARGKNAGVYALTEAGKEMAAKYKTKGKTK
jgi:hypothetical protein